MGGWLVISGHDSLDDRLARARDVLAVPGVPDLHLVTLANLPDVCLIGWAWNRYEIPDVSVAVNDDECLLLCGVVTSLGKHGDVTPDSQATGERILELWQREQERLLHELNGSFSIVHRGATGTMSLATDRFASRSVWTAEDGKIRIAGNFPAAIASVCSARPLLDPAAIWSMLDVGRPVANRSLFRNITALRGGEILKTQPSGSSRSLWYQRRYDPEPRATVSDLGREIATCLQQSAQRYERVCQRPHLFLSGGMDSRVAAASFSPALRTVTLCTNENFESGVAQQVASQLGLQNEVRKRTPYWHLDTMEAAAMISGGSYLVGHCHFSTPVIDIVAEHPESEFFLGDLLENFNKHYFTRPPEFTDAIHGDQLSDFLVQHTAQTQKDPIRRGIFLREEFREHAREDYRSTLADYFNSLEGVSTDLADRLDCLLRWSSVGLTYTYNMFLNFWPLAKERNIYLDNDVDDLSLRIPSHARSAHTLHYETLRHLSRKLNWIADANDFLPPAAPKILKRFCKSARPVLGKIRRSLRPSRKSNAVLSTSGSWLLTHELYRKDPRYIEFIEDALFDKDAFPEEIFERESIGSAWKRYRDGDRTLHFEIEGLLSLALLLRRLS